MKKLNGTTIKIIAIIAMVIDHIAFLFVERDMSYFIMRLIGRLAIPIMVFFIVEGFIHTKNVGKYMSRLLVFGLIAQIPYTVFSYNIIFLPIKLNIIFALAVCLLSLIVYDKVKDIYIKWAFIATLFSFSLFNEALLFMIPSTLIFYIFRKNNERKYILFSLIIVMTMTLYLWMFSDLFYVLSLGYILTIPILLLYDSKLKINKKYNTFFYIFYPLHLAVLRLIFSLIS